MATEETPIFLAFEADGGMPALVMQDIDLVLFAFETGVVQQLWNCLNEVFLLLNWLYFPTILVCLSLLELFLYLLVSQLLFLLQKLLKFLLFPYIDKLHLILLLCLLVLFQGRVNLYEVTQIIHCYFEVLHQLILRIKSQCD